MTRASFTITPEPMLAAPETWWQQLWRRLQRKPAPVVNPTGTQPVLFEIKCGDTVTRYYVPAARIEPEQEATR